MDRHVRWFRREIAVAVAQRLAIETVCVGLLTLVILLLANVGLLAAIAAALLVVPVSGVLRIGVAYVNNPTSSTYLIRWPRPSGSLSSVPQTNCGSKVDLALNITQFEIYGTFSELGGAQVNVYTSTTSSLLVMTSSDDDIIVLSGLSDGRLCASSTQFLPPHEHLVLNRLTTGDVRDLLASHYQLIGELTNIHDTRTVAPKIEFVVDLLATEWDAWEQIGPLLGPFVAIDTRFQPSLLRVAVSHDELRARSLSTSPPTIAGPGVTTPVVTTASNLEAPPKPDVPSLLGERARIALERTERAKTAGDGPPPELRRAS
ncbi:MAG: hypothetical protein ACI81L_001694 [Verrucomicrobiales bacterium]|jgi:hypothetical protein